MMPNSPAQQKAELKAAIAQITDNIKTAKQHKADLEASVGQFADAIDKVRMEHPNGAALMHIAEGIRMFVRANVNTNASAIASLEAQLDQLTTILSRLESAILTLPTMPPYPGGHR